MCGGNARRLGGIRHWPLNRPVDEKTGTLKFLRDLIVENWWLKLAALLLSFALWLIVRGDEAELAFIVPLTVQVPRNMEIVSDRPASVEVTVTGVSTLTGRMPQITYTIDLHNANEGQNTVALNSDGVWVNPAADVRVVRVSPARMSIVLERIVTKDVPIRVPQQGTPAAGMEVYKISSAPTMASISGRRSHIDPIREVATAPVVLSYRQESFQTKVNFQLQSDDIHASPAEVQVKVDIGVRRVEHTVTVPVTVSDPENFSAHPPEVAVTVLVPVTLDRKPGPEDFRVVLTAPAGQTAEDRLVGKPRVEPVSALDPAIEIRQVQPETVTLLRRSRKK